MLDIIGFYRSFNAKKDPVLVTKKELRTIMHKCSISSGFVKWLSNYEGEKISYTDSSTFYLFNEMVSVDFRTFTVYLEDRKIQSFLDNDDDLEEWKDLARSILIFIRKFYTAIYKTDSSRTLRPLTLKSISAFEEYKQAFELIEKIGYKPSLSYKKYVGIFMAIQGGTNIMISGGTGFNGHLTEESMLDVPRKYKENNIHIKLNKERLDRLTVKEISAFENAIKNSALTSIFEHNEGEEYV